MQSLVWPSKQTAHAISYREHQVGVHPLHHLLHLLLLPRHVVPAALAAVVVRHGASTWRSAARSIFFNVAE